MPVCCSHNHWQYGSWQSASFPADVLCCTRLRRLSLEYTDPSASRFGCLLRGIQKLSSLTSLALVNCQVSELPTTFTSLTSLQTLRIIDTHAETSSRLHQQLSTSMVAVLPWQLIRMVEQSYCRDDDGRGLAYMHMPAGGAFGDLPLLAAAEASEQGAMEVWNQRWEEWEDMFGYADDEPFW